MYASYREGKSRQDDKDTPGFGEREPVVGTEKKAVNQGKTKSHECRTNDMPPQFSPIGPAIKGCVDIEYRLKLIDDPVQ